MPDPCPVAILGVGPGDPELLTLGAARRLGEADLVIHPGPRDDAGFALEVVRPLLRPDQTVRGAGLAMRRGRPGSPADDRIGYRRVATALAYAARAGRKTVFLTEGDPMLFGSGSYLPEQLREVAPEVPVEVVAGVSSIAAAAARLGWPLAQKEQTLTICPATYHPDDLGAILDRGGPVCWLKAADVLPRLVEELARRDRLDRAALVERVGRPDERVFLDLTEALDARLSYFALVLVR